MPGHAPPLGLEGAILPRDVRVGGSRWAKGRRLSAEDLERLVADTGAFENGRPLTVLVPGPEDVHEDEAAARLAAVVAGPGLTVRGPIQSRVDLLATHAGVVHVRTTALERMNRIDPIEVFTVFDGQVVEAGDLVASVKIAPHLVSAVVLDEAILLARSARSIVRVAAFVPIRVGVVVSERVTSAARTRFERSVRDKIERLGSSVVAIDYVADSPAAVEGAIAALSRGRGRGRGRASLILTAGARSTDPSDPFFVAIAALGGSVVRRGVPAHPGSMLWLARVGRTSILGLPTCGAYSKATAADLVLPRLLSGEPASARTVAKLGHGGILTRDMRFRFPPYARELDAPEG
jgi:molybdenum cofactor cytidylyltransferase